MRDLTYYFAKVSRSKGSASSLKGNESSITVKTDYQSGKSVPVAVSKSTTESAEKRGRGRPKKIVNAEKRGRGRPKKIVNADTVFFCTETAKQIGQKHPKEKVKADTPPLITEPAYWKMKLRSETAVGSCNRGIKPEEKKSSSEETNRTSVTKALGKYKKKHVSADLCKNFEIDVAAQDDLKQKKISLGNDQNFIAKDKKQLAKCLSKEFSNSSNDLKSIQVCKAFQEPMSLCSGQKIFHVLMDKDMKLKGEENMSFIKDIASPKEFSEGKVRDIIKTEDGNLSNTSNQNSNVASEIIMLNIQDGFRCEQEPFKMARMRCPQEISEEISEVKSQCFHFEGEVIVHSDQSSSKSKLAKEARSPKRTKKRKSNQMSNANEIMCLTEKVFDSPDGGINHRAGESLDEKTKAACITVEESPLPKKNKRITKQNISSGSLEILKHFQKSSEPSNNSSHDDLTQQSESLIETISPAVNRLPESSPLSSPKDLQQISPIDSILKKHLGCDDTTIPKADSVEETRKSAIASNRTTRAKSSRLSPRSSVSLPENPREMKIELFCPEPEPRTFDSESPQARSSKKRVCHTPKRREITKENSPLVSPITVNTTVVDHEDQSFKRIKNILGPISEQVKQALSLFSSSCLLANKPDQKSV